MSGDLESKRRAANLVLALSVLSVAIGAGVAAAVDGPGRWLLLAGALASLVVTLALRAAERGAAGRR